MELRNVMRLVIILALLALSGCATYHKVEGDLDVVEEEYSCIGIEVDDNAAICVDGFLFGITVVW